MKKKEANQLESHINDLVNQYFNHLGDSYKKTNSVLYSKLISRVEKQLISSVLKKTNYNQYQAACLLGISRTTLRKKISIYHLLSSEV